MPDLPDFPGKDLIDGAGRRARTIAAGAVAIGGFVARRVFGGRGEEGEGGGERQAPARSGAENGEVEMVIADPGIAMEPMPPKPKPAKTKAPKPKAARSKPAASPKRKAPKPKPTKPPKPKAASTKPVKPKPPKPKAAAKPAKEKREPGDQRGGKDPHHALNNPVGDPDPTEYPDPFDQREDPRDPVDPDGMPFGEEPHPPTGAESTSEPPPTQDPEVGDRARPPQREKLDD